jgi:hypothetical protein
MLTLEKIEAKSFCKCCCCGETIRKCEKLFQLMEDGKAVRGERYCVSCEDIAYENNDIRDDEDDGESHLRAMEDYAAYSYAGCTQEYWNDRDAGYCH